MKKKLFFSITLIFISYTTLFAQSRFVIVVDGLRMRSEPDFTASTLCIIPYGEEIWQLTTPENWKAPRVKIRGNRDHRS